MRRGAEDEQVAEGAGRDGVVGCAIAGVEAALEADLNEDPCAVDLDQHVVHRLEVERDRLLAKRGQPSGGSEPQERRVTSCRSRDQQCVDSRADERRWCLDRPRPERGGDLESPSRVGVGDGERRHALEPLQRPGMAGADPADADHAYVESGPHHVGVLQ